jgi:hypothetical protein
MCRKQHEIDRALAQGMAVAQLIEALEDMPEDAVVVFGSDYGDICHTEEALIVAQIDEIDPSTERLETSADSHSGIAIDSIVEGAECDDARPEVEETVRIVILRSHYNSDSVLSSLPVVPIK